MTHRFQTINHAFFAPVIRNHVPKTLNKLGFKHTPTAIHPQFLNPEGKPVSDLDLHGIKALRQETALHSSKSDSIFRQQASLSPHCPRSTFREVIFDQIDINKKGNSNSIERLRLYNEAPVASEIYFQAGIIAYAPNRDELLTQVHPGQQLPTILIELVRKVRTGTNSNLDLTCLPHDHYLIPDHYKGSLYDPHHIITKVGFRQLLQHYTYVSSIENCYVTFEKVDDTNIGSLFPTIYAAQQLTFTLLTTSKTDESTTVFVSNQSSYPETISDIETFDALSLGQQVFNLNKDGSVANDLDTTYLQGQDILHVTTEDVIRYNILRSTGQIRLERTKVKTNNVTSVQTSPTGKQVMDQIDYEKAKTLARKSDQHLQNNNDVKEPRTRNTKRNRNQPSNNEVLKSFSELKDLVLKFVNQQGYKMNQSPA